MLCLTCALKRFFWSDVEKSRANSDHLPDEDADLGPASAQKKEKGREQPGMSSARFIASVCEAVALTTIQVRSLADAKIANREEMK